MIEFQQVTKSYGKELAIDQVSFQLEQGKIYGLLGPNGSGKSTTLKLIAGLIHPSKGAVFVNKKKVNRRIASEVAYLSELDMFYHPFTVRDMLEYTATQFQDFDLDKANELLAFMKLDAGKKLKQLSKGGRGRLKLVLALARKTSVILLDEPFSGLDPMVRESIVKSLVSFLDFENQVVIIATHEVNEIEPLLDEVIAINNGGIVDRRNVEEIREVKGQSLIEWMKEIFQER